MSLQGRWKELHGDEVGIAVLADLVNSNHVGMVDGGGQAGFAEETLHVMGVAGHVGMEDLEGDGAAQLSILSPIDGGEATGTDGFQDVVATDSLPRH